MRVPSSPSPHGVRPTDRTPHEQRFAREYECPEYTSALKFRVPSSEIASVEPVRSGAWGAAYGDSSAVYNIDDDAAAHAPAGSVWMPSCRGLHAEYLAQVERDFRRSRTGGGTAESSWPVTPLTTSRRPLRARVRPAGLAGAPHPLRCRGERPDHAARPGALHGRAHGRRNDLGARCQPHRDGLLATGGRGGDPGPPPAGESHVAMAP
jgi:hypothetical protein